MNAIQEVLRSIVETQFENIKALGQDFEDYEIRNAQNFDACPECMTSDDGKDMFLHNKVCDYHQSIGKRGYWA